MNKCKVWRFYCSKSDICKPYDNGQCQIIRDDVYKELYK